MREGTCTGCGQTAPFGSFYKIADKLFCEPCSWKEERAAAERGEKLAKISVVDGSFCARCKTRAQDSGSADFPIFKGVPLCPDCCQQVQDWPYPVWLKASLAGLLILLAVALIHGRKYFHAGRVMYAGERLVNEGRYAQAVPLLKEADEIAPQSDNASLLLAKAALHIGDITTAQKALQSHAAGHFETSGRFEEVSALWNRATDAVEKANKASELVNQPDKAEEAESLMRQAAAEYPEVPQLAASIPYFEGSTAFYQHNYDRMLTIFEGLWKSAPSATTAGTLAGALSCKYAATGDQSFRTRSEEMLEKSRQLALGDKQAETDYQEYSERIKHRMDTREIIDKQEYDRRFRKSTDKN
ncbi:MAG: tetratricopeptide repeat protein [Terriglobales bacterium]|jgi:tetratricopeptide (TPR) repeat protein